MPELLYYFITFCIIIECITIVTQLLTFRYRNIAICDVPH